MTDEQEQEAEDEQPTSGVVYLDWVPRHEGTETSQRVGSVVEVEVREGADEYDEGELVLHQEDAVAVFDRNELRGFRAQAGVDVPQYTQPDRSEDSSDSEGAE